MAPTVVKNNPDRGSNTNMSSSTSSSLWITKLQATTMATRKLQQELQPYLDLFKKPKLKETVSEYQTVMAKSILALTLATTCYLQPHLLRAAAVVPHQNNKTSTSTNSTASAISSKKKQQQQQQIRSDLNHIRQLMKQIQESHKRKESSSSEQPQSPSETTSKRRKRT